MGFLIKDGERIQKKNAEKERAIEMWRKKLPLGMQGFSSEHITH